MPEAREYASMRLEDVVLPPDDDMGIPSEDEDDDIEEIQSETGFGSVIVVDNLPVVPPGKHEKLVTVVRKIYGQIGTIREGGLWMPVDQATKNTKGYAFVEFCSAQEADAAMAQTDGYKLDKSHVFKVNKFDEFDKFLKVPDTYTAPAVKEYSAKANLWSWMMDERGRDQFAIRFGDDTELYWNDPARRCCEEVYRRSFWTESYVQWSPRGSMLTTVHRQGVAVWGGVGWQRLARFDHPGVQLVDFSPCEKYLVTASTQEPSNPRDSATVLVKIFNVRAGQVARVFEGPLSDFVHEGVSGLPWPLFKWAGGCDDKYFARMSKNQISVFSTPDMTLLDKKSVKVEGVADFNWCPTAPILSIYQPETGNQPARISLLQIPSRVELRQKNLFSVSEVKMYWQSAGEYLAVRVDKYTKTKKSTYSGFELFRVKERECPMEVLELESKTDKIVAVSWEPSGSRFAIIHGDGHRPDLTFYTMSNKQGRVGKVGTLKGKSVNALYWSPTGKNIVLAGLKSMNGQLEFFNVDEFEVLASAEHFMCTDVDWDPTGRYCVTSVSSQHQMENGFNVWSFNGKLLYKLSRDRFFQFLWRPRLPSLLSEEQEAEIVKNLRTYSKKYDAQDDELMKEQNQTNQAGRQALLDEYRAWQREAHAILESQREEREALIGHMEEEDVDMEEVDIEEIIDITEEIISM